MPNGSKSKKKVSSPAKQKLSVSRENSNHLKKVLAVNGKINSTLNLDELLGIIMTTSSEVMRTEAASLMLIDEETRELVFKVALGSKGSELKEKFRILIGEGIAGFVAKTGRPVIVNNVKTDKRFAKRFDNATGFSTRAILCVPLKAKGKIIGILEAINPLGRREFSAADLELFQIFADQSAIAIENARLHHELVQQETTRRELAIAHEIQQNFLPDLTHASFGLDLAAWSIPARQVGGDFYDVVKLEDGRISIIIGDVSGKGVPAALYMVRLISDYRLLLPSCEQPAKLLTALNQALSKNSQFGMFITMLCLLMDPKKNILRYASAGHHAILKRSSGSGKVDSLDPAGGLPVGISADESYREAEIAVQTGEAFFLYTDGIVEARNPSEAEFTLERLKQCVADPCTTALGYSDAVRSDIKSFTRGTEQHDDMTVVSFVIA